MQLLERLLDTRITNFLMFYVILDVPGEVIGAAGVSGSLGVNKTTGVTGANYSQLPNLGHMCSWT